MRTVAFYKVALLHEVDIQNVIKFISLCIICLLPGLSNLS